MIKRSYKAALCIACLTFISLPSAVRAKTITVSPGQSIQASVNLAVAGDTVQVLAGTYTQKILINNKNGSATNFITIKGDVGAIISGTGLTPSNREGLITVTNSSFVRIEGFDVANFTSNGTPTPVGILVQGSGTNIQLVNNKIHNIRNTSTCKEPCAVGAHGLAVFGTNATGIKDLLVEGNEIYQNVLQASEALVINGNVDRFEILSNNVHDNNNIGFDFIGYENECSGCGENDRVRNGLVRGNTAKNNSSKTNPWYGGQGSAGGFYVDGGRYIIFDRNISTGNDIGFEFASEHVGKSTDDILMMNNYVFSNREAGLSLGGSDSSNGGSRNISIHNNSFYKNKGWGTEMNIQFNVTSSALSNNIFFGVASADECYNVSGTGNSGNVWGKNMWWGTSTASSTLPGSRVIADPKFVAPGNGNLNLQSTSTAINVGQVTPNIATWSSPLWAKYYTGSAIPPNGNTDFSGELRIEGVIDLGADEFGTSTGATSPPAVPTLLTATAVSPSQINLSWSDNANNETGVRIERSLSPTSGFSEIAVTAANTTVFQNNGLNASTIYYYRVRSTNGVGSSAYTSNVSATTGTGSTVNIVVDGNIADWSTVSPISTNGTNGITSLKAYSDATYLYLLLTGSTNSNYIFFIDKDNSTTTGYKAGIWNPEGSDYFLENGVLHKYIGTGQDWNWSTAGVSQTGIQAIKTATALEVRIPRISLAGSGASIRIGADIENSSWTTVGTIPASGGPQAQFTF